MSSRDNSPPADSPEAFALACGMAGPLEVVATHRATGATQTYTVGRPFTFVGRAKSTGVRLDDPSVSQCHAYLQVIGGVPYCADLGSRAGVVWDDGGQGRGWVLPGQTLRVGAFDLRIRGPEAIPAPTAEPGESDRLPVVEVYAPEGGPAGRNLLDRPVTLVGRHPNCDLRLLTDTAPYFQCALVGTRDGVWCVDVWSPRGTLINGRPVRLARTRDGDLIEVGRASLVVRTDPGSSPPAPAAAADTPSAEALEAMPQKVAESLAGLFAPVREMLEQQQQCMTTMAQLLAAMQQEHAEALGEQSRQIQELAGELRDLRADGERESAAVRTFATTHQEQAAKLDYQTQQLQELAQSLRADVERERTATRSLVTTDQEHATTLGDQLRQAQDLTRELLADVERERTAAQTLAATRQEHAANVDEQLRQAQEFARELRADAERERAAAQSFATMQHEHSSKLAEQLGRVQELVKELRAEVEAAKVIPLTPASPKPVEPASPPPPAVAPAPPPTPGAARVRQAQTAIDTQTWSLDRMAMTVQPQFGTFVRAGQAQSAGAGQVGANPQRVEEAPAPHKAEAERTVEKSAERRQDEIAMGNEILRSVLADRAARLGADHPDTLATMTDLAVGYRDAGQWDQALPLLEESLRLRTARHGADHPDSLAAMGNLAAAYLDAKQTDKSLALLERYIPMQRTHLGADTPRFAALLTLMAYDLLAAGQYTVAESYLRECLAIQEGKQPDAWLTNQARALLGGSLLGQRQYAAAEPLLLAGYQGMKRLEKVVPPQGRSRLREVTGWLAELYATVGRRGEAEQWRAEGAALAGPAQAGAEGVPARTR